MRKTGMRWRLEEQEEAAGLRSCASSHPCQTHARPPRRPQFAQQFALSIATLHAPLSAGWANADLTLTFLGDTHHDSTPTYA